MRHIDKMSRAFNIADSSVFSRQKICQMRRYEKALRGFDRVSSRWVKDLDHAPEWVLNKAVKIKTTFGYEMLRERPLERFKHYRGDVQLFYTNKQDVWAKRASVAACIEYIAAAVFAYFSGWGNEAVLFSGLLPVAITYSLSMEILNQKQERTESVWSNVERLAQTRIIAQCELRDEWTEQRLLAGVGAIDIPNPKKIGGIVKDINSLNERNLKAKFSIGNRKYAALVERDSVVLYFKGVKKTEDPKEIAARTSGFPLFVTDGLDFDLTYAKNAAYTANYSGLGWLPGL